MTITAIHVLDLSNPVEVQTWLTNNINTNIIYGFIQGNYFYIVTNP
jgi:hypothetical protein